MDMTAITGSIVAGGITTGTTQAASTGQEFDTLMFEMLLKASGFTEAFTGKEGGQETAVFGDLAIQVLASELARDLKFSDSQATTTVIK